MKFEKGNKVVCIDNVNNASGLELGKTYTVENVKFNFVFVKEIPSQPFYPERFMLKKPIKPMPKKKQVETIIVGETNPKTFEMAVTAKQKEGFYIDDVHCADSGYVAVMKRG